MSMVDVYETDFSQVKIGSALATAFKNRDSAARWLAEQPLALRLAFRFRRHDALSEAIKEGQRLDQQLRAESERSWRMGRVLVSADLSEHGELVTKDEIW